MMIEEYSYAVIEKIVPEDDTIKVYFSEISNGLKTYDEIAFGLGRLLQIHLRKTGEKCDISPIILTISGKRFI